MKSLNVSFSPDTTVTLQSWIIIFGCIQLVLSQFPTIHDLRFLNVVCTMCTAGFAITATGLSIYNGNNPPPDSPPVDYSVSGGTAAVTFGVFSALGTIAFGFGRFTIFVFRFTVCSADNNLSQLLKHEVIQDIF